MVGSRDLRRDSEYMGRMMLRLERPQMRPRGKPEEVYG